MLLLSNWHFNCVTIVQNIAELKQKLMIANAIEPVHINLQYNVSPEIIFDAWIKPDIVRKWLFAGSASEIVKVDINPIAGGNFSILEWDRGNREYIDHYGKYAEIIRPHRLVFTLEVPKHFSDITQVTIEIEPIENGCELKLTQIGVSKDKTEKSWKDMLQQLKLVVENQ